MTVEIKQGNCLDVLKTMDEQSVNCCVTSPPYWGLRDYGTGTWVGGDAKCTHMRTTKISKDTSTGHKAMAEQGNVVGDAIYKDVCPKCGAKRVDDQLGLEKTPEEYVANMVKVFSEVKRVLRDDGTLWLNLGDSYNGSGGEHKNDKGQSGLTNNRDKVGFVKGRNIVTLKPKDLVGIPWRVALALQADGWYLRQDIIWHKPNPMPESVQDRCTKAHEYIFLLSKSQKYYYDNEAVKEHSLRPNEKQTFGGQKARVGQANGGDPRNGHRTDENSQWGKDYITDEKRNKRSVWTVNTQPYKEAHFAVYPPELIRPCILAGCPQSGVVLDPFGGSGTTGEVAEEEGRNSVLIELNPDYIGIMKKRTAQMGLFANKT